MQTFFCRGLRHIFCLTLTHNDFFRRHRMTTQITLSIWIFLLLLAITAWAMLDRVLIPSVRWFLRRRINRVIDEINTRLDITIKPMQLTKRQVLIDRLIYDNKVIEAIQAHAGKYGTPREVIQAKVYRYAREIVPSFNAYIYFRIGYWLAKKVARFLYRVRVDFVDYDSINVTDPNATVVFVMNHRSNMDYILVSFLAAERTALSYGVGEWAKIWPLQSLIKSLGAFFVRRKSGNPLYRLVLERYIHMATKEGVCQAVFPEGGLSRDGRLQSPKMGLIDYMLRSFNPQTDRDIVFIPVGINYDRTLEDRSLLRSLDPHAEKRSKWFVVRTTIRFVLHNLALMTRSQWQRFGFACVNFGPSFSAKEYCRRHRIDFRRMTRNDRFVEVEKLCRHLMYIINHIVPVIPQPLVAKVFLSAPRKWLSTLDVKAQVRLLIEDLESRGVVVNIPEKDREEAINRALNMMTLRRMIKAKEGRYMLLPGAEDILSYYAATLQYWFENPEDRGTSIKS